MNTLTPVVLSGWGVRLEPLALEHAQALAAASADGELWALNYTTAPGPDVDAVAGYIASALQGQTNGLMLPFVVRDANEKVLGSTRYYEIDTSVPTLGIGYTWYRASVQRTHVNTVCKRLLLGHAFDTLSMRTVYLHTSHANLRSQAAIERIGAQLDGVIRQHRQHKDGSLRDTFSYSMLDSEWPTIRDRLESRLSGIQR